jgi:hypothetical protein
MREAPWCQQQIGKEPGRSMIRAIFARLMPIIPHGYGSAFPRHEMPEVLQYAAPQGVRKTGCTLHPRSRMQGCAKNAYEHTDSAEAVRPSARNGFNGFLRVSPVTGLVCHRHQRDAKHHRRLDASVGASGPHDFAVRDCIVRQPDAVCQSDGRPSYSHYGGNPGAQMCCKVHHSHSLTNLRLLDAF